MDELDFLLAGPQSTTEAVVLFGLLAVGVVIAGAFVLRWLSRDPETQDAILDLLELATRRLFGEPIAHAEPEAWFRAVRWIVPGHVLEPFLNHMLVDRDDMIREGHSVAFVRIATSVEFLRLLALACKDTLVQKLWRAPKTPKG